MKYTIQRNVKKSAGNEHLKLNPKKTTQHEYNNLL